jgi:hypothetical protein
VVVGCAPWGRRPSCTPSWLVAVCGPCVVFKPAKEGMRKRELHVQLPDEATNLHIGWTLTAGLAVFATVYHLVIWLGAGNVREAIHPDDVSVTVEGQENPGGSCPSCPHV